MQKKRPTISDVAKLAQCSPSTVSLVLNNRGYVSPTVRKRVLTIIKDLSYHPSHSARGLASKTSGNFGFILSDDHFSQAEPFYTRIFLGTEFEARNHSYYILLTTVGPSFNKSKDAPRFLLERNVDGVILAGKVDASLIDYIDALGIPIVLVDYTTQRRKHSSVLIDNISGGQIAVNHLLACDRQEIAFIAGDINHPSIAERYAGYQEALKEHGMTLDPTLIHVAEPALRGVDGANAIHHILDRRKAPSAVFAANDAMAIGCIHYLRQRGINVPEDVAVIGFDDIDMSSHIEIPLTTIRVFKEEMGKLAVLRLVEIIKERTSHVVTTHVPVELIVRRSTPELRQQSIVA